MSSLKGVVELPVRLVTYCCTLRDTKIQTDEIKLGTGAKRACVPLQKALRTGTSTRLDERVFAMCEFKTQPLQQLMRMVHPDLYRLDDMSDQVGRGIPRARLK